MSENQLIIGLLFILTVVVGIVAAEVGRLNNQIQPIAQSSLVRGATSF